MNEMQLGILVVGVGSIVLICAWSCWQLWRLHAKTKVLKAKKASLSQFRQQEEAEYQEPVLSPTSVPMTDSGRKEPQLKLVNEKTK